MVLVILMDGQENKVVGRYDAWSKHCMEDAMALIEKEHYELVYDEVNANGDMILWVQ